MSTSPLSDATIADYEALTTRSGALKLPLRSIVELKGDDRAALMHNLCTNEIKKLQPGNGCEAFLTNVKGKILAHLLLFCTEDSLILDTVPGQNDTLMAHLDRYIITEDVQLHDKTNELCDIVIGGPEAATVLNKLQSDALPDAALQHYQVQIGAAKALLSRVPFLGMDCFVLQVETGSADDVLGQLANVGATAVSSDAFEIARIEAGFPWFASDISEDNLPQEVDRDSQTINFTKGCYLGQETVARIDALGHVNRYLRRLQFAQQLPDVGAELSVNEKAVGSVTSVAYSPARNAAVAMAYVRREHSQVDTELNSAFGTATVIE